MQTRLLMILRLGACATVISLLSMASTALSCEKESAPSSITQTRGSVSTTRSATETNRAPAVRPPSSFLSPEERDAFLNSQATSDSESDCPVQYDSDASLLQRRRCSDERHYIPQAAKQRARYPEVIIRPELISGVYTESFTPKSGVTRKNSHRVLINLHGGGFTEGARNNGQVESIPIAATGRIRVVSVDYRQGPEYEFPAASEDVAAVYRLLLAHYKPKNIGIYGCSSGGLLTAQVVSWFQKVGLPKPGAVGMFCAGGLFWFEGDTGISLRAQNWPYLRRTDPNDPLAFPGTSPAVMAQFPPSLLISGTRDFALSSVVRTHEELVKQGVDAELHVLEGMEHSFFSDPDLPQSQHMYLVVVRFFDKHLGKH